MCEYAIGKEDDYVRGEGEGGNEGHGYTILKLGINLFNGLAYWLHFSLLPVHFDPTNIPCRDSMIGYHH